MIDSWIWFINMHCQHIFFWDQNESYFIRYKYDYQMYFNQSTQHSTEYMFVTTAIHKAIEIYFFL